MPSPRSVNRRASLQGLQRAIGNQAALRYVQRKCSCGGSCVACQGKSDLPIGPANDRYEREADQTAARVMRMPVVQRKCAQCEEDESRVQPHLQRSESGAGPDVAPPMVHDVVNSPGRPLDSAARTFFEPRFGHDFSNVRVHTDGQAAESAQAVGALAYTLGDHMVFGQGRYQSGTSAGRELLAHELTHVLQQNNKVIRRTPDPATLATFDTKAATIRAHPAYLALADKTDADAIMALARTRDNCLYYIDKLKLLFDTPENPPSTTAADFSSKIATQAAMEASRLATKEGKARKGYEEQVSADPKRRWIQRPGKGGKLFDVDRNDPTNIVVRARVHLVKAGLSSDTDIANIRSYEDAIEKKIEETKGYVVDLIFVDADGPDVFTVNADVGSWPTSGNWVSKADTLAHELHHLLGLDDRYDYIESHADNADMQIPDRLSWFRVQMDKPPDPEGSKSLMGGGDKLLNDDVCRLAGLPLDACIKARTGERRFTISTLGGVTATPGLQGLAGIAARVSLRTGGYLIFNPYIGLNVLYSPTTPNQSQGFLAAGLEGGLRIQQRTQGAFLDISGGPFVGYEATLRGPLQTTAGLAAGIGAGWRWDRVEIGVQEQTLFPLTSGDPTRVLILGRVGVRFGQ